MADATNGFGFDDTVVAGADISTHQYKVINIAGTIAATNDTAYGILQNKPKSGEHAQVRPFGRAMAMAGGPLAANARLKVQSGYLITVASGDNAVPCGKNLSGSVASGDVFTGIFNFANAAITNPASL